MTLQAAVALGFGLAGLVSAGVAVGQERAMHRHRQPGVTYAQATFRRDGGWRQDDLFTPAGLAHQRRAARYGALAALWWVAALASWVILGLA